MKNLVKFNDFLIDKIFEDMNLKVKELELVLSSKMIKILKDMDHIIADTLLDAHIDDTPEYKITFVDLGSDPDKVSFIQSNKVPELIEPELVHGDYKRDIDDEKQWVGGSFDYVPSYKNPWIKDFDHMIDLHDPQFKSKDHDVWKKYRAEMKVGRFINKIFPKKFPVNAKREDIDKNGKPNDVESFVNMYIATVEANSKIIKIVEGDQILRYYNIDNYFKTTGTLGGSCMNSPERNNYMTMYSKNPDNVKMLVLYPENVRDKIIGRALLWKLDGPEGRYFMDRAYTANDSDQYMFIDYAKKNGWLYKSNQTYGHNIDIIDSKTGYQGRIQMNVYLKNNDLDRYPYLDTFQFYNDQTGHLTNDYDSVSGKEGYYQMTDAGGGRSSL